MAMFIMLNYLKHNKQRCISRCYEWIVYDAGEPAILNKFQRAKMAVQYVDLVVELPLIYAISSGELLLKVVLI